MTRNQICGWIGAALWCLLFGFAIGWAIKPPPKPEPDTWCPKRVHGYYLVGEKLTLEAYPRANYGTGTLTCKLEQHQPADQGDLDEQPITLKK